MKPLRIYGNKLTAGVIYCREHCVYCKDYVPQIERIASMEKVIEYIEGKNSGENRTAD